MSMFLGKSLRSWVGILPLAAGLGLFLAGCSSASKQQSAVPAAAKTSEKAVEAKPVVKETPPTVTVHSAAGGAKSEKSARATSSGGGKTLECLAAGEKRKLAVKQTPTGGCEVLYSKGGKTESIASAQNELSICDKTAEKVKSNLEKAGYSCESK